LLQANNRAQLHIPYTRQIKKQIEKVNKIWKKWSTFIILQYDYSCKKYSGGT